MTPISIKDIKLEIGELIRLRRKQQHLSQEELAEKMGVSRMTIQKLEAGKNATVDTLLKALRQFDLLEHFKEMVDNQKNSQSYPSLY
ncbi:helix-turn-helix domain-containing protein [Sediminibacterium ginsengisoli]|uniref:Helix-turn-helix n=1 Tax=Sediminibacterium ginsengisoli TaxID=413434 RepID=A0A1T4K0Y6_9BACT|nr:helix-turn-helix transcriptional regulator [Sediminibacterium ginsengisoli]SJZ36019.1 Helix-turn-helix [Sediminibacterium ginsengisoli]